MCMRTYRRVCTWTHGLLEGCGEELRPWAGSRAHTTQQSLAAPAIGTHLLKQGREACGAGWSQRGRKSPSGRGVLAPRSHRPRWRRTGRGGFVSSSRGLCPTSRHPTAHQDTGLLCDPDICSTQRCVCVPVSVHACACREHAVCTHVHAMGMQGRGALCAGSRESSRGSGPCSCDGHNGPAGWWRARAL